MESLDASGTTSAAHHLHTDPMLSAALDSPPPSHHHHHHGGGSGLMRRSRRLSSHRSLMDASFDEDALEAPGLAGEDGPIGGVGNADTDDWGSLHPQHHHHHHPMLTPDNGSGGGGAGAASAGVDYAMLQPVFGERTPGGIRMGTTAPSTVTAGKKRSGGGPHCKSLDQMELLEEADEVGGSGMEREESPVRENGLYSHHPPQTGSRQSQSLTNGYTRRQPQHQQQPGMNSGTISIKYEYQDSGAGAAACENNGGEVNCNDAGRNGGRMAAPCDSGTVPTRSSQHSDPLQPHLQYHQQQSHPSSSSTTGVPCAHTSHPVLHQSSPLSSTPSSAPVSYNIRVVSNGSTAHNAPQYPQLPSGYSSPTTNGPAPPQNTTYIVTSAVNASQQHPPMKCSPKEPAGVDDGMAGYSYGYAIGEHQDPNGGGYCISQAQHHPTYSGQQQQHGYAVNGGDHLPHHHQMHPHHQHHTMVYADELTSEGEYSTPPLTAAGSGGQSATASAFSLISGDVEELNTRDLAQRISQELKRYSIPQAIFAQKVLCRSQGTLSDLLRNPKPWSKLKSGRETFRRMAKWLQEPEYQRMSALRIAACKRKEEQSYQAHLQSLQLATTVSTSSLPGSNTTNTASSSATTNQQYTQQLDNVHTTPDSHSHSHTSSTHAPFIHLSTSHYSTSSQCSTASSSAGTTSANPTGSQLGSGGPTAKKPRLVFTDIQRRTLQAIFRETKRPSREMQLTISQQLGLDPTTVANFFMNARRRGHVTAEDEQREQEERQKRGGAYDEAGATAASLLAAVGVTTRPPSTGDGGPLLMVAGHAVTAVTGLDEEEEETAATVEGVVGQASVVDEGVEGEDDEEEEEEGEEDEPLDESAQLARSRLDDCIAEVVSMGQH